VTKLRLQVKDLGSAMNQFAAERYAQELCIRYVSRNQPRVIVPIT
jgi:hypothetical protein